MNFAVSVLVAAEPEKVFAVLSDVERSAEVLPNVVRVEITSDVRSGVGLRWRETRLMMGREAGVEHEVTDFAPPGRIGVNSTVMGTSYMSSFVFTPASGGTHLVNDFRSSGGGLFAGIFDKMASGRIKAAMQTDLDAIKRYCESAD